MSEIVLKVESYAVMGACFEVYKVMGPGFLESVYQECLRIEFKKRGIPFVEEPKLTIFFLEDKLEKYFEPDFVCYDQIVLEIKATSGLTDQHRAPAINAVKAARLPLGLLVNFCHLPQL
jgi:GxxExxY protein